MSHSINQRCLEPRPYSQQNSEFSGRQVYKNLITWKLLSDVILKNLQTTEKPIKKCKYFLIKMEFSKEILKCHTVTAFHEYLVHFYLYPPYTISNVFHPDVLWDQITLLCTYRIRTMTYSQTFQYHYLLFNLFLSV